MTIIDTPFNTTPHIGCLSSQGISTVIRYYNFSNSRELPEKRIELAEAQALAAHGIRIAVVFQQRHDRASDFDVMQGAAAGRRAYRYAEDDIGQPTGSAIYFGVDFDANADEVTRYVVPYFEGVARAFSEQASGSPAYRVGAYGSGLVCTVLQEKGLIDFVWLASS